MDHSIHCSMKRIQLPSASFTYISLVPQVWSTGPVSIRTFFSVSSAWRASTLNDQVGHTTRNSITGKRGDVQPDTIARQAHVAGIWFRVIHAMGEFPPEAEPLAIEVLRRSRVRHMEERDGELEQVAPPSGSCKNKKASIRGPRPLRFNPGGDLRSHTVTRAVSSALRGLTSVFGMGTGVTPAVWPPGNSRGWRLEIRSSKESP